MVISCSDLVSWNGLTPSMHRPDRLWTLSVMALLTLADNGDAFRLVWSPKQLRAYYRVTGRWWEMVPPGESFSEGFAEWCLRTFESRWFRFCRFWSSQYPLCREWPVEVGFLCWRLRGIIRLQALSRVGSMQVLLSTSKSRVRKIAQELHLAYSDAVLAIEHPELARIGRKNSSEGFGS